MVSDRVGNSWGVVNRSEGERLGCCCATTVTISNVVAEVDSAVVVGIWSKPPGAIVIVDQGTVAGSQIRDGKGSAKPFKDLIKITIFEEKSGRFAY